MAGIEGDSVPVATRRQRPLTTPADRAHAARWPRRHVPGAESLQEAAIARGRELLALGAAVAAEQRRAV